MHPVGILAAIGLRGKPSAAIAWQLLKAFEEAKNRSLVRAGDLTASYFPVPLLSYAVQDARAVAGADFWPYGIEANRVTLEAFLRYAHEQGVSQRKVEIEELFVPEVSAITGPKVGLWRRMRSSQIEFTRGRRRAAASRAS